MRPDVVVLDLSLPDLDGCEVIRRMRGASSSVFIVAHSGYERTEAAALEAGADVFVLKPDVEALQAALDRADAATQTRKSSTDA